MDILEGAAAFAVVMIVMSTIVTGLAEAALRLLSVRQTVLVEAIERLVADRIAPALAGRLKAELNKADASGLTEEALGRIGRALTRSPLANSAKKSGVVVNMRFGHDRISTYSFLQRLARTELGDALAEFGRAELRDRLTDIARSYERYVASAAERFRYKAHRYSAIIAVLFAFGANIDAGRVFVHLMENPEIRERLIEQAEPAFAAYQKAEASLQDAIASAAGDETVDRLGDAVEEAGRRLDRARSEVALPIGPNYYPYCSEALKGFFGQPDCTGDADRTFFGWMAYTLLAGVLIGLGGPFWYRVYSSLSQLLSVARAFKGGEVIDPDAEGQPASKAALTEEDIVTTFRIARANDARQVAD